MKLYSDFHTAILKNEAGGIIQAIKPHPRLKAEQQFAIYSDGYRIRLVQAIRSDYPVLLRLLGDKKFDDLATNYIEHTPPNSYSLDFFPHKFAEFLTKNHHEVFTIELAILEAAIAEVFMLPDSEEFTASKLAKTSAEKFGEMRLKLRHASQLLRFSYPINRWFTEARTNSELTAIPKMGATYLLLVRHNNEVQRHDLSEAEFILLENLAEGQSVAEAIGQTINKNPEYAQQITENLQSWFMNWVVSGVFVE